MSGGQITIVKNEEVAVVGKLVYEETFPHTQSLRTFIQLFGLILSFKECSV